MTILDSEQKFAELILYISQKSSCDFYFGATKLNKILYLSDFRAYGKWGEPITGAEYQHLPQGPAPRRLKPVRDALIARNELAIQPVSFPSGKIQQRTVNLREADLSLFEAKEISLVDSVIDERNQIKSFVAQYTVGGASFFVDVAFAVSAAPSHTRASAWYTSDAPGAAGVAFTLDGTAFTHCYYNAILGTVAIHATVSDITPSTNFNTLSPVIKTGRSQTCTWTVPRR